MHVIQRDKKQEAKPFVPIISRWEVPEHRKLRGKRYNARGEFIGETGPPRRIDPAVVKMVRDAYAAAAKLPKPEEGGAFDLARFRPLPGRVLVIRGPQIKEEKGIVLPEDKWRHEFWYVVICIGAKVTNCEVGDRVIFQRKHIPKPIRLGRAGFYLGRAAAIVGMVDSADPI